MSRADGVIHGVKVLGRRSPNSHRMPGAEKGSVYTEEALREALPLYENADVKLDHRDRNNPSAERPVATKFGKLRNVRLDRDGTIRADLHYLKSHPFAARVLEDVERGLGVFGLSHDAQGQGDVKNGYFVIHRITEVRSVDLVDQPATNTNLWESREMSSMSTTITLREALERKYLRTPAKQKAARAALVHLLEQDYMAPEDEMTATVTEEDDAPVEDAANLGQLPVEVPMEDGSGDANAALWGGMRTAMIAIIDDQSLDAATKTQRLKEFLTAHDKLTKPAEAGPEPVIEGDEEMMDEKPAPVVEGDEPDGDEMPAKDKMAMESRELKTLRAHKAVTDLCESLSFQPTPAVRAALVALPDNESRKALILESKAVTNRPRSSAPLASAAPVRSERTLATKPEDFLVP